MLRVLSRSGRTFREHVAVTAMMGTPGKKVRRIWRREKRGKEASVWEASKERGEIEELTESLL